MNLIHYLVEANLYLAAFYLLYVLLLRSETLYQLNRAYLLATSLVAFVIPLLQLGILKPEVKPLVSVGTISIDEGLTTVSILPTTAQATPTWTLTDYALAIYGAITLLLLAYLIFKIIKLIALSKKGIAKQQNGFTVIEIPGQNVAFSFFGYLFVNTELLSSPTILHHEEVHIRQKHSWDVIYLELLKIINWFNPVVYLLQKSLKEVHEFIADQQVASSENGASDYADFLISNAYGLTPIQLTNSFFNKNLLKRRIIMLYQKRSSKAARLKYLLTLPLLAGLLCASTMAFTNKTYAWVDLVPANATHLSEANGRKASFLNFRDYCIREFKTLGVINGSVKLELNINDNRVVSSKVLKSSNTAANAKIINIIESYKNEIVTHPGVYFINCNYGANSENVDFQLLSPPKVLTPEIEMAGQQLPPPPPAVKFLPPVLKLHYDKNSPDPIYNISDHQPEFPGGQAAFAKFLQANVRYPRDAKEANVQGRAIVQFVVEKDGSLSGVKIMHNPGMDLGAEAVRVLKLSPKWEPGTQKGEKVRVMFFVPVNFSLEPNDKKITDVVLAPPPNGSVASFPGGQVAFVKFLQGNVRYPRDAKVNGIQGKVTVHFTVNEDGRLSDMSVASAPRADLGAEAMRVMKLSPNWVPAVKDGEKISTEYTVPINFSLTDDAAPNDINAFYKFIQTHVRYPKEARDNDIQGRTFVQFTVNDDKQIQNIKVVRTPDDALGAEVVRVLQKFDKISDAKTGVNYVIAVNFYINKNDSKEIPKPDNSKATGTPFTPKQGDNVMLNEVVVVTFK